MTEFAHWELLHKTTVPTAVGENSTFDQKRSDQRWTETHDKCSALSHYKHNQHDNAELCGHDYTQDGDNGTYGQKQYSSFFKTVYCSRTKQTTSRYIWHQHLIFCKLILLSKTKRTWTSEQPTNFAAEHDEPREPLEEGSMPGAAHLSCWADWIPSTLFFLHATKFLQGWPRCRLEMACSYHKGNSSSLHLIPCLDLKSGWKRGQLGAGWMLPWNAMAGCFETTALPCGEQAAGRSGLMCCTEH